MLILLGTVQVIVRFIYPLVLHDGSFFLLTIFLIFVHLIDVYCTSKFNFFSFLITSEVEHLSIYLI